MLYLDPLYGQFEFGDKELKLFQTSALTRIRDISLSVVPPMATPAGMITSRFEHSVGAAFLAQKLTKRPGFEKYTKDLYLAALFHDAGSPPFSHASEIFLEDLTGKDHEEFVEDVLQEDDVKKAIIDYGGNIDTIYKLITGTMKPWSDLLNGSIDIDNIDNTLRWGMGIGIFQNKFYEPEELIKAYIWQDDKLALKQSQYANIQKWELCRRLAYDVIYSDLNLAPNSLLFRALEIAYQNGDLNLDFFRLTESQALYVLENRTNPITQSMIRDLRHWIFYKLNAQIEQIGEPTEAFKTFCTSWKERQKLADIIADSLSINKQDVTIYAGKDKGFKQIHLPFIDQNKRYQKHQPLQKLYWRIKIYLHPKHTDKSEHVQDILENIVKQ